MVQFNSIAEKTGFNTMDMDRFYITKIETPYEAGINHKILFIPALLIFAIIYMIQSVRRKKEIALA